MNKQHLPLAILFGVIFGNAIGLIIGSIFFRENIAIGIIIGNSVGIPSSLLIGLITNKQEQKK